MENKRLGLTIGKTINVGNYESLRVDVTVSGDIGNKEFCDEVEDLSNEAHALLNCEAKVAISKHHEGK